LACNRTLLAFYRITKYHNGQDRRFGIAQVVQWLGWTTRNQIWLEQFCDYLLENYVHADSNFLPHVWSECSASSFRAIKSCESFQAHFNALFYIACSNMFVLVSALKIYKLRPTSKWEAPLHKRLNISATVKKEFIS
jgi:hypothetical protein